MGEVADVQRLDPVFFENRIAAVLKPDGLQCMENALGEPLTFLSADLGDGRPVIELKPGGRTERVTETTKEEYVQLLAEEYLLGRNRLGVGLLCKGFRDMLPLGVLRGTKQEKEQRPTALDLELLIAGTPEVDVADWQRHCGGSAKETHPKIFQWFWEVLEEMDQESRARVLNYACGSARMPGAGFAALVPKFVLVVDRCDPSFLPTAHTCVNQLHLPPYEEKSTLEAKLRLAIETGADFGFA